MIRRRFCHTNPSPHPTHPCSRSLLHPAKHSATHHSRVPAGWFNVRCRFLSRMKPCTRRKIRKVTGVLLILGSALGLGFLLWFNWAWTDLTTWGAWSKPQTFEEHCRSFVSSTLKFYWPELCVYIALIVAGVLLLPPEGASDEL